MNDLLTKIGDIIDVYTYINLSYIRLSLSPKKFIHDETVLYMARLIQTIINRTANSAHPNNISV